MNVRPEIYRAEGSALVAEALRLRGRLRLQVRGESMLPALWPGDTVEIERCSLNQVRRGDIVLALRDGCLFLHRFLRHCPRDGFVLRGDSMPKPDPVFPSGAFLAKLVPSSLDRSLFQALPPVGCRALGFVLCHCGMARRFALRLHRGWNNAPEMADSFSSASPGDV